MADNVTIPAQGTGTTTPVVATDDVAGVHYQRVKLDGGGDGASNPFVAGAQASANSLPVVGPNDEFVTVSVDVTRPTDTTTYAINDAIANSTSSTNAFTVANAVKASGGSGIITDVVILSDNDPATTLQGEIMLLDGGATTPVDNATFSLSDSDAKKLVGKIPFVLEDIGNNQFFHAQGLNIGFTCTGSADLRFVLRAKNAYVPANGETLTFRFKIQRLT